MTQDEQPKAPGENEEPRIPRASEDELRDLVNEFLAGHIYTSDGLPKELLVSVFMPLAFGAFENWPTESLEEIGILYEHISKAGPMAVNGHPCFFSFHILHKDDWERVKQAMKREQDRRDKIEV